MQNLETAFTVVDKSLEEMIGLWKTLVNIDSGTEYKEGVDRVADVVASALTREGLAVNVVRNEAVGNSVVAVRAGEDKPPVFILGHMDTVFPPGTAKERPFTIKDGKAYGPGVLDMKGGIVQAICAMRALNAIGWTGRPVKICFVGDEETGHESSDSQKLIEKEVKGSIACFNLESGRPDGSVVIGRKGVGRFRLEVQGVAAHAGNEPEKGRSAIRELCKKVLDIEALTDFRRGITLNVGVIKGGTVANAVPDRATAEIDLRFPRDEDYEEVERRLKEIAATTYVEGTSTVLAGGRTFPPMVTTDGVKKLFEFVKERAREIGIPDLKGAYSGGGSDAAYTVRVAVPTICAMGPRGGLNHSPREYAEIDGFVERTKLLISCIVKI